MIAVTRTIANGWLIIIACLLSVQLSQRSAHATVLWFSGAETGDLSEGTNPNNSPTVSTTTVHGGNYSFALTGTTGNGPYVTSTSWAGVPTLYFRGYIYLTGLAASIANEQMRAMLTNSSYVLEVITDSSGNPSLQSYNPTTSSVIAGSTVAVSLNTWHLVEVKLTISATVGEILEKVDGSQIVDAANLNTGTANTTFIYLSKYNAGGAALAGSVFWDDIFCNDQSLIGPGYIIARQAGPAIAPFYNSWTKNGCTNIYDSGCINSTPFSATANITDALNDAAKQSAVVDFTNTQSGHGTQVVDSGATIHAAKIGGIFKTGSTTSDGADSVIFCSPAGSCSAVNSTSALAASEATTDTYQEVILTSTPTTTQIRSNELGVLKGSTANTHTVEDMWEQVDFKAAAATIPTLVQQQPCAGATTSMACPSITTTAGNTIVVLYEESSTSFTPSITDNRATHLTWSPCPTNGIPIKTQTPNFNSDMAWYANDPTGGPIAVTIALGGADVQTGNVSEWSGVASSSALDNCSAGATDAGSATTAFASGNASVSQANDVVFGFAGSPCCSGIGNTISAGPTNGFSPLTPSAQSGGTIFPAYLVTSSGASTAWTAGTAAPFAGLAFSLKAASIAGGPVSLGTCKSAVGTAAVTLNLTDIASGQSLVVFHKGQSTDPTITDTLSDTFTAATAASATVNSATGGCLNFDVVVTPKCVSFPCSDTLTVASAGASQNNAATVCEVNNYGGIDALGGTPYTFGNIALSGPLTPLSSGDLALASFYIETPNSFAGSSHNYLGTGTPTDIAPATLSDGSRLVGAATEAGVANSQIGLSRTSQPPVIRLSPPVHSSGAVAPTSRVKLKILAFPSA